MKSMNLKENLYPHLIALSVFIIGTILFFAPVVFEGKVLPQHDILQSRGGAQEIVEYREQGEQILWTNSMFGGMPSYLVSTQYSGDFIYYIYKGISLFFSHPISLVFISFACCYIMLLAFGVRTWIAIAGAFAFGFNDFSIIGLMAGHNAKVGAVAYMPLIFAGVHMAFTKNQWKGMLLTSLGLALQIWTNHLQITYYLLLIILFYGLYQLFDAISQRTIPAFVKTVSVLFIGVLIAVGCNFSKLWTVMEYSKYSTRGKTELSSVNQKESGLDRDYVFKYSNGIYEPLFLFIPNFMGGSAREDLGKNSALEIALKKNGMDRQQIKQQVSNAPAYWGDQPLTAPYYAGAIVVFLFVLGLVVLEGKFKYWMVAVAALGIILSWGHNFSSFNYFFYDYFPGYNKFRSVTFTIIIPVFVMVLIGFLGLEETLKRKWDKQNQKSILIAFSLTGGFALLCVLFAGIGSYTGSIDKALSSYPSWFMSALREDRASLLRSDALRSLLFVVAFVTLMWFYFKNKVSKTIVYTSMILLVFIDMFGISKRFINSDTFQTKKKNKQEIAMSEADLVIRKDSDINYRVMNLINPFNDAVTSYHHKSIGGYHGAKMGRYQDLIERAITPELGALITNLKKGDLDYTNANVINMLNTKYFIAGDDANAALKNGEANGNAWFVSNVESVNNPNEEIDILNKIDTKTTAVIDQSKFELTSENFGVDSLASIKLLEYSGDKLVYESNSGKSGLAVFSEIYYPEGWVAKVDGVEVPILRANYVLRAIELSSGSHKIEFSFVPDSYFLGSKVTWFFNILLILLLLTATALFVKEKFVKQVDI